MQGGAEDLLEEIKAENFPKSEKDSRFQVMNKPPTGNPKETRALTNDNDAPGSCSHEVWVPTQWGTLLAEPRPGSTTKPE